MVSRMQMSIGISAEFMFVSSFFVLVMSIFCDASDTIRTGESLFPPQTIVSRQGAFELGFFSPGTSTNFFVGIWYKNMEYTVVWVANRDSPIPNSFVNESRLELLNGNLYIMFNSKRLGISMKDSNATEAVLLDTGNLVLRNASGIIWQSFDNPTDTWLPGGTVGFRWTSNTEAKLVSWRNQSDPGTGNYSLGMEPNESSELFMKDNSSHKLWRSGRLQGLSFPSIPNSSLYYFSYFSGDDAVYLTYNVFNESSMVRIVIDHVGRMMHYLWSEARKTWVVLIVQPSDFCKVFGTCGPNALCDITKALPCSCLNGFSPRALQEWNSSDFSGGCVRMRPMDCAEGNTGFLKESNIRLPANPEVLQIRRDIGVCELLCRVNCTCSAYAYNDGGGCLLFTGNLLDMERITTAAVDLYVRIDSMEVPENSSRYLRKRKILPVVVAVPITVVIFICLLCYCYRRQKFKSKEFYGAHQNLLLLDLSSIVPKHNRGTSTGNSHEKEKHKYELPIFDFSSIASSTNNFSIKNKLGEGGFGPVYKGQVLNGQFVAVKRLSRRSGQGLEEFRNETELIAKLQHRNLVGILGCCFEHDEKILVYEYMPNKSLDFFLFDPTMKEALDWNKRVHIIEGIAQGLLYLHHYSRLRIVHRDLKASNILLDTEMNPKISDFGMARIFGGTDSQANTERIVGTYGYMSPEYAMEGLFSVKSDVFAFGVLVLEIISGKKNTSFYGSDHLNLLRYAWDMWKQERIHELTDPSLEMPASTALRYIQIGLLCVHDSPEERPLISDVVVMLNNEGMALASPRQPIFSVRRTLAKAISIEKGNLQFCSLNGLTFSEMEAR